jgi:hypothetical protein
VVVHCWQPISTMGTFDTADTADTTCPPFEASRDTVRAIMAPPSRTSPSVPPLYLMRLAYLRRAETEAGEKVTNPFERQKTQAAVREAQGRERERLEEYERNTRPSLLESAYDPGPLDNAMAHYRITLNPIFAITALSRWPVDLPLPRELRHYLAEAFGPIVNAAEAIAVGSGDAPTAVKAAKAVPHHLGLTGGRGAGSGAFADFRDYLRRFWELEGPDATLSEADRAAAIFNAKHTAFSGKATDLYRECAMALGIPVGRFRTLLTEARSLGLVIDRKRRASR